MGIYFYILKTPYVSYIQNSYVEVLATRKLKAVRRVSANMWTTI